MRLLRGSLLRETLIAGLFAGHSSAVRLIGQIELQLLGIYRLAGTIIIRCGMRASAL
jgi:hypothetical protein